MLPWEIAGRGVRLASLTCFLIAFGLPVSLAAVALVMAAQAGGRLVPFGPAGTGVGLAILAMAFGTVTGETVPLDQLAAFVVGTSADPDRGRPGAVRGAVAAGDAGVGMAPGARRPARRGRRRLTAPPRVA